MSNRKFSVTDWDARHFVQVDRYAGEVETIYQDAVKEAAQISVNLPVDHSKPFAFTDYPQVGERVRQVLQKLASRLLFTIQTAQQASWLFSGQKNDALVGAVLGSAALSRVAVSRYMSRNLEALAAFQNRKLGGLGLSERVFAYTNQFRREIELGLDIGLGEGRSAQQISRDLRSYLTEPDKLFRRVRSARGNLALSQNAQTFHPGQGVYRSSYKNAVRLARTEINSAYRTADYERWQSLDFVVGIRVARSNNIRSCDVCPSLVGLYPKDFLFRGWHPQCMCYATPVLATRDELNELNRLLLTDQPTSSFVSENVVSEPNKGFTQFMQENADKFKRAKNLPYFVADNPKYTG